MNIYIILITIFGAVVLLTAWLPTLLKSVPFSLPMACISLGAILALFPFPNIPNVNPLESRVYTERITEFVLIISLMGAGLKLDRPVGWQRWGVCLGVLRVSMSRALSRIRWGTTPDICRTRPEWRERETDSSRLA